VKTGLPDPGDGPGRVSAAAAQESIEWREDLAEAQGRRPAREHKPLRGRLRRRVVFRVRRLRTRTRFRRPSSLRWRTLRLGQARRGAEHFARAGQSGPCNAEDRLPGAGRHDADPHLGALPAKEFRGQLDRGFLSDGEKSPARPHGRSTDPLYTPLRNPERLPRRVDFAIRTSATGRSAWVPIRRSQSLRFGIDPRTPSTLPRGSGEAHVTETWSKHVRVPGGEGAAARLRNAGHPVSLAYGVLDELGAWELQYENRSGSAGSWTASSNAFHRTLGLTDAGSS